MRIELLSFFTDAPFSQKINDLRKVANFIQENSSSSHTAFIRQEIFDFITQTTAKRFCSSMPATSIIQLCAELYIFQTKLKHSDLILKLLCEHLRLFLIEHTVLGSRSASDIQLYQSELEEAGVDYRNIQSLHKAQAHLPDQQRMQLQTKFIIVKRLAENRFNLDLAITERVSQLLELQTIYRDLLYKTMTLLAVLKYNINTLTSSSLDASKEDLTISSESQSSESESVTSFPSDESDTENMSPELDLKTSGELRNSYIHSCSQQIIGTGSVSIASLKSLINSKLKAQEIYCLSQMDMQEIKDHLELLLEKISTKIKALSKLKTSLNDLRDLRESFQSLPEDTLVTLVQTVEPLYNLLPMFKTQALNDKALASKDLSRQNNLSC